MEENQESASTQQKSSNPSLVIGIIVVIIIIAGAFWLFSNNKNAATTQQQTTTEVTVTQEPAQTTGTESATPEDAMMAEQTITVEGGNFFFKPNEVRVKKGEKVTITFTNSGGMHNFVIDELNVTSETINSGSTKVEFTPDKAGTYEFYCSIGNHRSMGMKGTLIVE